MPKRSVGILLWRRRDQGLEVLLAHPGGPFWRNKDAGAWSIVKGEVEPGEDEPAAARREFKEETGSDLQGPMVELGEIRQKGGKTVRAWAVHADLDPATIDSNEFEIEWPPRSGTRARFPEIDRAAWFPLDIARTKINPAQAPFLTTLERQAAA